MKYIKIHPRSQCKKLEHTLQVPGPLQDGMSLE